MKIRFPLLALSSCVLTAAISARADAVAVGGGTTPPPAPAAGSTNGSGPQIVFATNVFDFGKAKGGEAVKHEFIFTNTGDALLEISAVQPQCGCTTAGEWSKKVEPGKTGTIPLQFNTGNYNGDVVKQATVTSNAKNTPTAVLQIKGNVWRPVDVIPNIAYMTLNADTISNATSQIRIVNNEPTPLDVYEATINNKFYAIDLVTNKPGKEFSVNIKTSPPMDPNNLIGQLSVKTTSTNTPVANVTVYSILQQAVVASPPQINLPHTPLTNQWSTTVTIRNQVSAPLSLSEPSVNAEGVAVKVNELEPGRFFNVTLTFPDGFKVTPEEKLTFSVKTSNAQFQTIKIPIIQLPAATRVLIPSANPVIAHAPTATPPVYAAPAPGQPVPLTKRAAEHVENDAAKP